MRWLLPMLLTACADFSLVPPGGAGAKMKVCPSPLQVPPVATDALSSFPLGIQGRDALVGLRWLPSQGSRLDLDVSRVGERFIGVDGDRFDVVYTLRDAVIRDTGGVRDDGILRLFFRESPTVDVWVEVVRGEARALWEERQDQIAQGVRDDPCAGIVKEAP